MNSGAFIQDHNNPFDERFRIARLTLVSPERGDSDRAIAKCWLTYRALEGHMPFEEWDAWVRVVDAPVKGDGKALRWQMSQTVAEAYYLFILGRHDEGVKRIGDALELWRTTEIAQKWPSQITNFLRASFLNIYVDFLKGVDVEKAIDDTINEWRKHVANHDYKKFPYRFAEAHDDRIVLAMLMFICGATGLCKMPITEWCNPALTLPGGPTRLGGVADPFYRIVRSLESLNPSKALWQP